jgi:hypothetical protein
VLDGRILAVTYRRELCLCPLFLGVVSVKKYKPYNGGLRILAVTARREYQARQKVGRELQQAL